MSIPPRNTPPTNDVNNGPLYPSASAAPFNPYYRPPKPRTSLWLVISIIGAVLVLCIPLGLLAWSHFGPSELAKAADSCHVPDDEDYYELSDDSPRDTATMVYAKLRNEDSTTSVPTKDTVSCLIRELGGTETDSYKIVSEDGWEAGEATVGKYHLKSIPTPEYWYPGSSGFSSYMDTTSYNLVYQLLTIEPAES
ncbi:hypothetical protein [Kocuria massiliensis]|uniref:hypothetical protein n=1 Tax=Kocuria massiliensis TaxID=1926282 RepID=UPI0022B96466|nr:hypothetical protein [Kocuria massiliensis]